MDTYPCPACGGVADESTGCHSCGRAHDPDAAALAELNRRLAGLDRDSARLASDQSGLRAERARVQADADALKSSLLRQLTLEAGGLPPTQRIPDPDQPAQASPTPAREPTPARPTPTTPSSMVGSTPPRQRGAPPSPPAEIPETSPRSAQNTLLTLGGVLLGIAAVVVTGLFYTTSATGGRALVLAVATLLALSVPLLLTRRTLTATAETIAAFGLLLVLLDGYAAYNADLVGLRGVSLTLFSAVLFGLVAAVAAAYRLASHLRAPQFAALLAVQPFLPLIAAHLELDRDGFGAVFAVVAALNLGSVELLRRDIGRAIARVRLPGAAPGPGGQTWPRLLRELAWILFGATLAVSVTLAVLGLVEAGTVDAAVRSALVLLLAAAVGVVAGQMSGRHQLAQLASGAAALAVIGSASRVNALALPEYTLVLTAAVAATIALGSGLLPPSARQGPGLGSLFGAALTAAVVLVTVAKSVLATIQASITPAVWAADIAALPGQAQIANWQVPAAAVLIAIVGVAAAPPGWRVDALVGGAFVVTLALPGTGTLAWWAIPLVAWAVSTVVISAALVAGTGRSTGVRAGVAGLLGLYALGTSLPRAELTAAVATLLFLVAAGITVVGAGSPHRLGPYAHRVADSAGGAAAFTLPVAVGTVAWLVGAAGAVLVPLTLLAIAVGVFGAALSQAVASTPRTGGVGGALGAAAGGLVLALLADGAELADIGLAVLLLVAAAVALATRAFESSGDGPPVGAVGTPDESGGVLDEPPRRRGMPPVDGRTAGAALATAALIIAMARVGAVAVPGIGLVTTMAMVLAVSVGVRVLPDAWRRGPRLGAGAVGGSILAVTASIALAEAARTLAASTPYWHADLAGWSARVGSFAPYGWQVPASLLLAAAAAFALLPAPTGGDIGFVTLALAGLAMPAVTSADWWTPPVIAGAFALLAGIGAALVTPADAPGTHRRRLALAAALGLYATAASGATAASTGIVLSGIVAAGVLVAALARIRGTAPPSVAGIAAAAALAAVPGAAATNAVAGGAGRSRSARGRPGTGRVRRSRRRCAAAGPGELGRVPGVRCRRRRAHRGGRCRCTRPGPGTGLGSGGGPGRDRGRRNRARVGIGCGLPRRVRLVLAYGDREPGHDRSPRRPARCRPDYASVADSARWSISDTASGVGRIRRHPGASQRRNCGGHARTVGRRGRWHRHGSGRPTVRPGCDPAALGRGRTRAADRARCRPGGDPVDGARGCLGHRPRRGTVPAHPAVGDNIAARHRRVGLRDDRRGGPGWKPRHPWCHADRARGHRRGSFARRRFGAGPGRPGSGVDRLLSSGIRVAADRTRSGG